MSTATAWHTIIAAACGLIALALVMAAVWTPSWSLPARLLLSAVGVFALGVVFARAASQAEET